MYRFFKKLYGLIIKFEEVAAKVLLILIVLITFCAAVGRFLNFSFMWSLDLVLLLFAWFAFLSSSQAIRRKSVINMTLLVNRLPKKVQTAIAIFNDILMIAFMAVVIYYSIHIAILNWRQRILTLQISYSWILLSLSIGGALMTLGLIVQFVEHCRVILGKGEQPRFELYPTRLGGEQE